MFGSGCASAMRFLFGYNGSAIKRSLRQRRGTESEYLPTELDSISRIDGKTKKDEVVDLLVWPQRS